MFRGPLSYLSSSPPLPPTPPPKPQTLLVERTCWKHAVVSLLVFCLLFHLSCIYEWYIKIDEGLANILIEGLATILIFSLICSIPDWRLFFRWCMDFYGEHSVLDTGDCIHQQASPVAHCCRHELQGYFHFWRLHEEHQQAGWLGLYGTSNRTSLFCFVCLVF